MDDNRRSSEVSEGKRPQHAAIYQKWETSELQGRTSDQVETD